MTNATCFTKHAPLQGPPLIQHGQLTFQAHHVGWIVAGFFTIVACVTSFWLIGKHLIWYTNKRQQRYIVRLLLMVPIYATVSLASYVFWNHAIPITLARDCYESFVLYSFFYLLLQYLSPTTAGQKEVFRKVSLKKWVFPLGFVKYRPEDGLYFLQLMKWGVLQYSIIRPTTTLAAVILDFVGLYCEDSWSPGWGHVYITIIVSLSVTIAMYCLIQLYIPIATQLAPYKPLLKLLSVKAVVFLTFWQATGLSALSIFGVIKDTKYMTAEDIETGIAAILETFEMMCFAFLHIRAFSYKPYQPEGGPLSDRTPRFRSLIHALDFRDMWREIHDGSVYMSRTIRGVEVDEDARRRMHFEKVMGRGRELSETNRAPKRGLEDWIVEDIDEGLLDTHRHHRRRAREAWWTDPSDRLEGAFEDQIEGKPQTRGLAKDYGTHYALTSDDGNEEQSRGESSWWKGIYDRLSSGPAEREREGEQLASSGPRKPSRRHRSRKHRSRGSNWPSLDSPPPPSLITYDYPGSGNGRSSVRLSQSNASLTHVQDFPVASDAVKEPLLEHHYRHHDLPALPVDDDDVVKSDPNVHMDAVVAPRPTPAPRSHRLEQSVSNDDSPQMEAKPPGNEHNRVNSSRVMRSDSLLARVFPNSTSNTLDGHTSSEGRSNPASSRDTLPIQHVAPPTLSLSLVDPTAQLRGRHAGPLSTPVLSSSYVTRDSVQSPPSATKQKYLPAPPSDYVPKTTLPMTPSPARWSVESPRARKGDSTPKHVHRRSTDPALFPESAVRSLDRVLSNPQDNFGSIDLSTHGLERPRVRVDSRQSTALKRPPTRQKHASNQPSTLQGDSVNSVSSNPTSAVSQYRSSHMIHPASHEHGVLFPDLGMLKLSRFPASPIGIGPPSNLTNPSISSPPVRPQRPSRDGFGEMRFGPR